MQVISTLMTLSLSAKRLNVVVLEDDLPMQHFLCAAINTEPALRLAGNFSSVRSLLQWLRSNEPDVLLVDLGLPDGSGIEVIKACAAAYPECDILVISVFGDDTNVLNALDAGAKGYILKEVERPQLSQFIAELRSGGSPMSPLVARKLLNRLASSAAKAAPKLGPPRAEPVLLTEREREVLGLIARGYTYHEIGKLMNISFGTVQTHVKNIYTKLSVHSKSEAVFEARHLGLMP